MENHKGSSFPSPVIPILGFFLGVCLPFALVDTGIVKILSLESSYADHVHMATLLVTLRSLGAVSFLFFVCWNFCAGKPLVFGISQEASFFAPSFCIFSPSAMAGATGADAGAWMQATIGSWIAFFSFLASSGTLLQCQSLLAYYWCGGLFDAIYPVLVDVLHDKVNESEIKVSTMDHHNES